MICDDSPTILKLLATKLKVAGHEIVGIAKDGEEGIKVYSETLPEITILDITMPNKDGRECLAGIIGLNPFAKVIMVSAIKDEAVVEACLKAGAKAFTSKSQLLKEDEFKMNILDVIDRILTENAGKKVG
jgi:two-component system chemotaxis response regulator CheY